MRARCRHPGRSLESKRRLMETRGREQMNTLTLVLYLTATRKDVIGQRASENNRLDRGLRWSA